MDNGESSPYVSRKGTVIRGPQADHLLPDFAQLGFCMLGLVGIGMNALLFRWESTDPVDRKRFLVSLGLLALFLVVVALLAPPLEMRNVGWGRPLLK